MVSIITRSAHVATNLFSVYSHTSTAECIYYQSLERARKLLVTQTRMPLRLTRVVFVANAMHLAIKLSNAASRARVTHIKCDSPHHNTESRERAMDEECVQQPTAYKNTARVVFGMGAWLWRMFAPSITTRGHAHAIQISPVPSSAGSALGDAAEVMVDSIFAQCTV